jgi:hypothetical protein
MYYENFALSSLLVYGHIRQFLVNQDKIVGIYYLASQ